MQVGMVGLGRMGANMAERLRHGGHEVIGYDRIQTSPRLRRYRSWWQSCPSRARCGSWSRQEIRPSRLCKRWQGCSNRMTS